ncbi:MAG: SOS response-associated peptidase [Coriobacteriia bacterium]|nr:SOS response-associated peptidase [Coriobacteriia bacterium]
MCGRYQIEIDDAVLREICEDIARKQREQPEPKQLVIKFEGEVFPSDIVPVQTGDKTYEPMKWGFTGFDGKLLINARSETALQKQTFRRAMLEQRCLIPASWYYEWQRVGNRKIKHRLYPSDRSPLFFAGCYQMERGAVVPRFVILTQNATMGAPNIAHIHDRMPVIVAPAYHEAWFSGHINEFIGSVNEFSGFADGDDTLAGCLLYEAV